MTVSKEVPRWPAWAHDRKWAWRLENIEPLCIVAEDYLKQGQLLDVVILDSDLRVFKVSRFEEVGFAGLFGWRPGFRGTYLRVEPTLRFETQFNLEIAKNYLVDFLKAHPRLCASGLPRAEIISNILAARSSEQLFAAL